MVEGVAPVTRFRIAASAFGWWMSTRLVRPIEKPCQLTMAVCDDCVIARAPPARRSAGTGRAAAKD
jgi:hypothetical protein